MVGALPEEVKGTRQCKAAGLDQPCRSFLAVRRGRLARTHRKRGQISGLSEHFIDFRGMHLLGQDHLPRELLERN